MRKLLVAFPDHHPERDGQECACSTRIILLLLKYCCCCCCCYICVLTCGLHSGIPVQEGRRRILAHLGVPASRDRENVRYENAARKTPTPIFKDGGVGGKSSSFRRVVLRNCACHRRWNFSGFRMFSSASRGRVCPAADNIIIIDCRRIQVII